MSVIFSVAMPICTFFAFIFFLMRYQIEKYNFVFVYHQEYESVVLLDNIAKLQIYVVLFFQLVNFTQIQSLMIEDGYFYLLHYIFISVQVLLFIGGSIFRRRYPEKWEQLLKKYFFLPNKAVEYDGTEEKLSDEIITALGEAYRHPHNKLDSFLRYQKERREFAVKIKGP